MHYSNLDLHLKLILTWASERFLQVPPFCVAGHPTLGFQPPARSISSTDPPMWILYLFFISLDKTWVLLRTRVNIDSNFYLLGNWWKVESICMWLDMIQILPFLWELYVPRCSRVCLNKSRIPVKIVLHNASSLLYCTWYVFLSLNHLRVKYHFDYSYIKFRPII
jgi:hypothetical protein